MRSNDGISEGSEVTHQGGNAQRLCPGISKIASFTWNGHLPSAMPTLLCSRRKSGPRADGEKPVQSTRSELQAALADFENMEESRYKEEFKQTLEKYIS